MSLMQGELTSLAQELLKEKLSGGEEIVWADTPARRLFRLQDIIAIPFMTIWTTIAATMFYMSLKAGTPALLPFWLLSGSFVCLGLYMTVGRFIHEYLLLKNCLFVLTQENAYVICWFPFKRVKSFPLRGGKVTVVARGKNYTDIVFDDLPNWEIISMGNMPGWQLLARKTLVFFNLCNVHSAVEHLQNKMRLTHSNVPAFPGLNNVPLSNTRTAASKSMSQVNEQLANLSPFKLPVEFGSIDIQSSLEGGEQIVWEGKPKQCTKFRKTDACGLVLCTAFWFLVQGPIHSLLSSVGVEAPGAIIFGTLTVLTLLSWFLSERMLKIGLKYAVTNKRVIGTLNSGAAAKFYSIDLRDIRTIEVSDSANDCGVVTFNKKDGALCRVFGAEGILINPGALQMTAPFLFDVSKPASVARIIEQHRDSLPGETKENACIDTKIITNPAKRSIPAGLIGRMLFLTEQARTVLFVFFIVSIITTGHFFGYGMRAINELAISVTSNSTKGSVVESNGGRVKTSQIEYSVAGKTYRLNSETQSPHKTGEVVEVKYLPANPSCAVVPSFSADAAGFPSIMFLIPLAFFVGASGLLMAHLSSVMTHCRLLICGAATTGQRLSDERIVCQTNGRPSLCQRMYTFVDHTGRERTARMFVSTNANRPDTVTVLFDPTNPDKAVVLDELPGELRIAVDGRLVCAG